MDAEAIELVLANRSYLYALLARAYAEEIDEQFAREFASEHALEEIRLVQAEQTAPLVSLWADLADAIGRHGAIAEIGREYVRLFVGPGTCKADPWETVHLSGRRALFQPGVLEVREAYRNAGFLPVRYQHVPDDFIGVELDFLAKLAVRAQDEWPSGSRTALGQSREFLEQHLLRWIGSLAERIQDEYGACFYAKLTQLASLVAQRDLEVLEDLELE